MRVRVLDQAKRARPRAVHPASSISGEQYYPAISIIRRSVLSGEQVLPPPLNIYLERSEGERFKPADRGLLLYLLQYRNRKISDIAIPSKEMKLVMTNYYSSIVFLNLLNSPHSTKKNTRHNNTTTSWLVSSHCIPINLLITQQVSYAS